MTMIRCIQYIHPPSNSHNMPPASQVRNRSEGTYLRKTTRKLPFLVGNPTEKTFICTTVDPRYPRYHNPMISIGISATSEAIIERTRSSAVGQAQWNHLFQMTDVLYLPKIQQMVVFYKMRLWLLVVFWTSANGGFLWGLCLFDIFHEILADSEEMFISRHPSSICLGCGEIHGAKPKGWCENNSPEGRELHGKTPSTWHPATVDGSEIPRPTT